MKILKFNDFLSNDTINESNSILFEEDKKEMSFTILKDGNNFDFTEVYKLLEE